MLGPSALCALSRQEIPDHRGSTADASARMTLLEPIDTSEWPSRLKVILPSRAFLLSWREQTLPTRKAALEDAARTFEALADSAASGTRDMAVLAVIAEAMQPLEDLAYLATAWDSPYGGLAKYVRATVYSARTPTSFWQGVHKREDEYFDVVAGFSARDASSGTVRDTLEGLGAMTSITTEQIAALQDARHATRRRLRRLLTMMATDWRQFSVYFYAYKHGGLAANRDDVAWVADDIDQITPETPRRVPSVAVWHRGGKATEGSAAFKGSSADVVRNASGIGWIALDLVDAFIESRLSVFEAVVLDEAGSVQALRPMQLPWTIWLREADLPADTWKVLGRGPWISWTGAQGPDDRMSMLDG